MEEEKKKLEEVQDFLSGKEGFSFLFVGAAPESDKSISGSSGKIGSNLDIAAALTGSISEGKMADLWEIIKMALIGLVLSDVSLAEDFQKDFSGAYRSISAEGEIQDLVRLATKGKENNNE